MVNLNGLALLALSQFGSRLHSPYLMTEIYSVSQERLEVVDRASACLVCCHVTSAAGSREAPSRRLVSTQR